jgi:ABC-2 type transport system permease protein
MLRDAIAAESYKFRRDRSALFWGFFAVPLGMLLFKFALDTYLALHNSGAAIRISAGFAGKMELGPQIIRGLELAGSSFFQIFYIAGAAALFAGEYRWETWRLLVPRNARANLVGAKLIVYALACAASLLALAVVGTLGALYSALLNGIAPSLPGAGFAAEALIVFLAAWAELLILGAFTALVAVASRAMIGALLAGIFFSFAQGVAMLLVHPWEAPLRFFAYLPSMSAYLLRAWASGQEIAPGVLADPAKLLPATLFLLAWIGALAGATIALFQAQDLSRE